MRDYGPGPLFQRQDGTAVTRSVFVKELSTVLKFCGLDPVKYKGHSFLRKGCTMRRLGPWGGGGRTHLRSIFALIPFHIDGLVISFLQNFDLFMTCKRSEIGRIFCLFDLIVTVLIRVFV